MQRHLEGLAATLPALPGDAGPISAFVLSSEAIRGHFGELYERVVHGGDAAAAIESAALLRQLAALGDTVSAVGHRLAASSGPTAEAALITLCRITSSSLLLLDQLEKHPLGGGGRGSMHWAGLLAWPTASLSALPLLLPLARHDNVVKLNEAACGVITAYLAASSSLGADAVAEAQAHVPAALRIVLHAADRLAMPGHASFCPTVWPFFMTSLQNLFGTTMYGEAAAAALAAAGPDNKPGRQLAACLLDFVCCLAEMGPPASCTGAPGADAAAHNCYIVHCWRKLLVLNANPYLKPFLYSEAARGDRGMRLLTTLAGLLERLHEQQRQHQQQWQADASLALLEQQAAHARLDVAGAACNFTAIVLASYGGVLAKLLPPPQAAGQGQLQGSLLHAAQKGLQYALHAARSLPHAAAVFAAAAWAANCDRREAAHALIGFITHATGAGKLLGHLGVATIGTAQSQVELLASFEATLRRAPELQRHVPPAAADVDVSSQVSFGAHCAVAFSLDWAAQPGLQLTTDEAERLMAAAAALSCTICKCSVLRAAEKAAAARAAGAAEAARAATAGAGAGAGAAGAAAMSSPGPSALEDTLLAVAANCDLLFEAVARHATPSARMHSLLRCVRQLRAEVWELLLHLLPQDLQDKHLQSLHDAGLPSIPLLAQQQGEEAAASLRALATARRCCHMGCTNLAGSSEAELPTKRCSGCRVARFCSAECSRAAWRAHKQVCRQIAAEATQAAQAGQAGGNESRTADT